MTGLLLGTALLIPSIASAQDRSFNWQRGGQDRSGGAMVNGDNRREAVQAAREARRNVEQPRPAPSAPAANPGMSRGGDVARVGNGDRNQRWSNERGDWNRGGQPGAGQQSGNRNWTTERGNWDGRRGDAGRPDTDRRPDQGRQADRNDRRGDDRNWNGRSGGNDRNWADRRDNDRRDWNNRRDNDRRDWDNRGWNGRDNDRWDRNWRTDRRYSWQDYRRSNRSIYRLPRYQAPRWGYNYQRWTTGHRFDSWFYSSSYWIDDPWSYRLPPAYGDYRWVRYYDDAALVDIRTGEIVDIIYSFFF